MSTPRTGRKISQLPILQTASLNVYVVGYSGDTTYRLSLDALEDAVINTLSASLDNRIDFLETVSTSFNEFSTSVNAQLNANSASALEGRLDILESFTGSYATTGSNLFRGAITASYFKGDGSALTNVTGALSVTILDEGIYKGGVTTLNFSGSNVISNVIGGIAFVEVKKDNTLLSTSSFNAYTQSLDDAIIISGSGTGSLTTIKGNLNVEGNTSILKSTNIHLYDNIIELNSMGEYFAGLLVKDPIGSSTVSGSLKWNSNLDRWEAGKDAGEITELSKILLAGGDNVISSSQQITALGFTSSSTTIDTSSLATTGSNVFKGQQIISGALTVSISGNAFGVNENVTPNNIFWSYIPNDTNTTSIEPGWIVNIETFGTYTVTNVEYDYPFVKITLSDALLQLPYRCNGYFSLPPSELKFGTDGILKISGSLDVSGSITGSTDFNTIVNKPTLVSGSSQLTSSLDTRYAASGSAPTLFLLEAYANETYTLPGGFTDDVCRYNIVNNTVNVPSNWFNTSTYRFTPQKAGYWEITAEYDVYRGSGVEASIAIKKNGGVVAAVGSFGAVSQLVTKIVYLNGSTDYINIINVGNTSNSRGQFDGRSWFQAKWIGE